MIIQKPEAGEGTKGLTIKQYEDKCRTVHLIELGHILYTERRLEFFKIAERVLSDRLESGDLQGK